MGNTLVTVDAGLVFTLHFGVRPLCHTRLLIQIHGLNIVAVAAFLAVVGLQAGYFPPLHRLDVIQVFIGRINFSGYCRPDLATGLNFSPQFW